MEYRMHGLVLCGLSRGWMKRLIEMFFGGLDTLKEHGIIGLLQGCATGNVFEPSSGSSAKKLD